MTDTTKSGIPQEIEPNLERRVSVRTGRDRFRTDVMVRGHPVVVDEPVRVGGTDLGPTPFDLMCAALGSCVTITLRMYADRKKWPLEEVLARVEHRRITREVDGAEERRDSFEVTLEFRGPLDDAQRARLLEIAGRCPVHRALVEGVDISTGPLEV